MPVLAVPVLAVPVLAVPVLAVPVLAVPAPVARGHELHRLCGRRRVAGTAEWATANGVEQFLILRARLAATVRK
jgi:hypothetical protein